MELKARRKDIRSSLRKNITRVASVVVSLNSGFENKVYSAYKEIGEVEEKIATLEKVGELYDSIKEISKRRDELQLDVNRLVELIERKRYTYLKREPEIKALIEKYMVAILKEDIGTEEEFKEATDIEFDFSSNYIAVNGKSAFSESGEVYLKNAFHLALLLASLEKEYIRIPRLMILDGIENGGMEDERSKNFQRVAKKLLDEHQVVFQLIFTTKSIYSCLDNDKYIVGEKYGKVNKSLKIG